MAQSWEGLIDIQSVNHICMVRVSVSVLVSSARVLVSNCVFCVFVDTSRKLSRVSIYLHATSIYLYTYLYVSIMHLCVSMSLSLYISIYVSFYIHVYMYL